MSIYSDDNNVSVHDHHRLPHASYLFHGVATLKQYISVYGGMKTGAEDVCLHASRGYFFDDDAVRELPATTYLKHASCPLIVIDPNAAPAWVLDNVWRNFGPAILFQIPLALNNRYNHLHIPAFFREADYNIWRLMCDNIAIEPMRHQKIFKNEAWNEDYPSELFNLRMIDYSNYSEVGFE